MAKKKRKRLSKVVATTKQPIIFPSNKDLVGKFVILKDIQCSDFMKDEEGKMKVYDSSDDAAIECGFYELENVIVLQVVYNHVEKDIKPYSEE